MNSESVIAFEDLQRADDRGLRNLMMQLDTSMLILALKSSSDELKKRFFSNVSSRAAEILEEELAYVGPVRADEVEQAQREILELSCRLARNGEMCISGFDFGVQWVE